MNVRTLLVLGRVSNLPTVWSNCVAGWLLGGGGNWLGLALLCLGASFLYAGGMYLNDAFDAQFDQQHRAERPIPSGQIRVESVWLLGFGWLIAGLVLLGFVGSATFVAGMLLAFCILVYDALHKIFAVSPIVMALCRFLLYLTAASVGSAGITGLSIWSGLVMACYIVGLSYIARKETIPGALAYWPCALLAAPIFLALLINTGPHRSFSFLLCLVFVLWVLRSLCYLWWGQQRNVGLAVSGLLAGIVWVDWLAVADQPKIFGAIFIALFLLALLFQRFIPAT